MEIIFRWLKPCTFVDHRGKVCGRTPTKKTEVSSYENGKSQIIKVHYHCKLHYQEGFTGFKIEGNYYMGIDLAKSGAEFTVKTIRR